MPRVPTYDNFQVMPDGGGSAMATAPSGPNAAMIAGDQMQRAGQAVEGAAAAGNRILVAMQADADKTRVNDAMNQYVQAQTGARLEAMQLKGRNALERPNNAALADEYGDKLKEMSQSLAAGLGNTAQRKAFSQGVGQLDVRFRAALGEHVVQQQSVFRKETQRAMLDTAANQASLLPFDGYIQQQSAKVIARTVDDIAKDNGMDDATKALALAEAMTPMHLGVMKSMISAGRANDANAYYVANNAGMTRQGREQMQGVVKQASDTQTGEAGADAVWAVLGPNRPNDPVKSFDMERELRAQMSNNPDAARQGIAALRERTQAFNAQQAEVNNAGVNAVFGMVDDGTSMREIQRSAEWMALPETKQRDIRNSLAAEASAREGRAAAAEGRAAAAEGRRERALLLGNGDAYLRMSSPDVLVGMSRGQVEATRTIFGMEGAMQLLTRFDQLRKPGAIAEARMDKQDFDQIADAMGLDPFNAKTPDAKRDLGTLQFRVEQLIDRAQRAKNGTLTREEKMELMRGELARAVTVAPRIFGFDRELPVVQLNRAQADRVVVPKADEALIGAALKAMAEKDPYNPAYAPTDANVRRLYLRRQSRAADLIGPAK